MHARSFGAPFAYTSEIHCDADLHTPWRGPEVLYYSNVDVQQQRAAPWQQHTGGNWLETEGADTKTRRAQAQAGRLITLFNWKSDNI